MAKNKYIDYTNDQLENLINEIYAGSISASVLPVDLYHAINARLLDAVWKGFGGSSSDFVDGSADKLLVQYYEHNIAVFSGAKTFQQVKDMSNAVFKPDGYKRDFSDFKKLITGDGFHDGIFRTYNVNWLRTEYDTAFATAQMGRQWNEYVADAETFPLLKYVTVHDERVRHDHKAFDGVTLPIGHSFWNTHTPPNGFNCRCRLIQLSEFDEYTITDDGDVKNLPDPDQKLFEFNPGKDGYIFDESKHPYSVKVGERFKVAQSVNFGFPTPPKPVDPLPTPKIPKTIKKKTQPKTTAELIDTITNGSDVEFAIGKMFNDGLKRSIKKFDFDFGTFPVDEWKMKLKTIDNLTTDYNLSHLVRDEIGTIKFKGGVSYYGRIVSSGGGKWIDEIDFGKKTDTVERVFDSKSTKWRSKSRVDAENIPVATIVHEFAHVICVDHSKAWADTTINAFWGELSGAKRRYNARMKKIRLDRTLTPDEKMEKLQFEYLGNYSGTNANEFMAEGFTEYKLSSNPSPVAVEIGQLIDRYFKKGK
jgi:SPP1 gp7 family putative phage head morphogenesis protein